jgi:hypothetical protein
MTELKFNFIKTGEFAGTGELYVNGKKVGETDLPCRTTIMSQLPGLGPAVRQQTHLSAPQGSPAHLNSPAPFFRWFPPAISVNPPKFLLICKKRKASVHCHRGRLSAIFCRVTTSTSLIVRQYPECVA